ncbi:HAD family phosphatase [Thalassospira sp. MCCC 1A01428]|uniref:HAD family hydrolase n=1 Tax=Thalassospira sp. MCCC 1A01428 TaxID=1470575 RepID=UPI000A1D9049|nr:HAD family phosphatase [Thalassospira sp. MCCC 1A01428]OSQ42831.1 haloacid dehalogenase [Thalassospira sp. MCCC 1A01428]
MDQVVVKPKVGAVLFDCDGVLVDTENLGNVVLVKLLNEYGCPVTEDMAHQLFMGGTLSMIGPKMHEMYGVTLPDNWTDECYARTFESLRNDMEPFERVDDILDMLDVANVPFAIGSNGPHNKMDVSLGKVGLLRRFTGRICSARDVPNAKPAPDVYHLAASRVGVDIHDCVVIDDSISGVRAGVASGAITIGLIGETPGNLLLENGAHYIANDHHDLYDLLQSWL